MDSKEEKLDVLEIQDTNSHYSRTLDLRKLHVVSLFIVNTHDKPMLFRALGSRDVEFSCPVELNIVSAVDVGKFKNESEYEYINLVADGGIFTWTV